MCPAMNTMRGVGVFPCNVVRVRRQCSRIHHHSSSFHNNNNGRTMRKCFVVRNSSSKLDDGDDDAEADVIVIGSGIGGLSCAAMLARYEQDVVLLESHDVAGGAAHSFDVKGYKFDSGPSLFSGLQSRGPQANPLAQVLDALGESVPCATYDSWMVYVPEADFLSRIGPTEFLKDLQNYAGPEAVREWQKLLDAVLPMSTAAMALPPLSVRGDFGVLYTAAARYAPSLFNTFFQMGPQAALRSTQLLSPFSQILDSLELKHPFIRNWIDLLSFLLAGVKSDSILSAEMVYMFAEWYKPGGCLEYPLDGAAGIVDALVRGLKKFGGRIYLQSHVEKIVVENERAIGVKLRSGQELHLHLLYFAPINQSSKSSNMDREMVVDNGDSVNNDDLINDINQVKSQLKQIINVKMGYEIQLLNVLMEDIDKRQRICVVVLLCHIVRALHLLEMILPRHARNPTIRDHYEKERRRVQLMTHLVQTERCRDIIRMSPAAFMKLCEKLRSTGIVKDSTKATIEEQVAKFLHIVGHNVKNRTVSFFFHRSGETVSRHFHNVLRAIISLVDEFIVQPTGAEVPPEILHNPRFFPFFKDCIGAIDGTHSRVKVRRADAPRFRGRKEYTTQNVFAACSFDMKFTYVLSGWEGTASDSRILKDALSREDSLLIPEGKYYLGDAGFPLKGGILTPYRGVRYHLKEYSARGPQNHKELFNLRHSSLRNVIERTFGVLKKRFPIIGGGNEPYYSFPVMTDIFIACCILHNYLMGVDVDNQIIAEVDQELQQRGIDRSSTNQREEDYRQGANIRENVSTGMWNEYPL